MCDLKISGNDDSVSERNTESVRTRSYFLSAGEVNAEGEMSLTLLCSKLIDIATAHANALGIGNPVMADSGLGWVLSRLTVELDETPRVNTTYAISTWVESWNRHFSERAFKIFDPDTGRVYGYSRSIWLVLNMTTRENAGLSHLTLPAEAVAGVSALIDRQSKHTVIVAPGEEMSPRQLRADKEPVVHSFKYCDVDFYRHVNTVRYVALLLNQYSLDYHDEFRVRRMELSFLHEAVCGEPLELLTHHSATEEDGDTAVDKDSEVLDTFYMRVVATAAPILYARLRFSRR
ncbi:MAG: hypothetical protein K2I91_06385 [Muribaculaceae bacterium]|nr:hypothetical protein [Muribaculaceae bacterium]